MSKLTFIFVAFACLLIATSAEKCLTNMDNKIPYDESECCPGYKFVPFILFKETRNYCYFESQCKKIKDACNSDWECCDSHSSCLEGKICAKYNVTERKTEE